MRLLILILLGLAFVLNYHVLRWFYPLVETDYNQYIDFVAARSKVYEAMFALFFLLTYLLSEKIMKAVAGFFMVMAVSSFIDKTIFNITSFLKTDWLVFVISGSVAIIIYLRERGRIIQ